MAQVGDHETQLLREDMHPLVVDASTSLAELETIDNDSDNSDYDETIWDWMEADEDETNDVTNGKQKQAGSKFTKSLSTTDREVEFDCDGEGDYREVTATKDPLQRNYSKYTVVLEPDLAKRNQSRATTMGELILSKKGHNSSTSGARRKLLLDESDDELDDFERSTVKGYVFWGT
ncbi:hypothetical protein L2E82_50391 [Cichorium intybus]|nr:hypothetical protein L2E82_50391 [Cichorium intybus]